jgi:hypothetical protein
MQNVPSWFFAISLTFIIFLLLFMLFTGTKIELGEQTFGFKTPDFKRNFSNNKIPKETEEAAFAKFYEQKLNKLTQQVHFLSEKIQSIEESLAKMGTNVQQSEISLNKERFQEENSNPIKVEVLLSSIEVFSLPKFKGKVITHVNKATPLIVLEEKESWYQIKTPDEKIGWISKKWVK